MNGICQFRLCTLSDEELTKRVDKLTDEIYMTGKIPTRNIPARPDDDYDLLIGELLIRFDKNVQTIVSDYNFDRLKIGITIYGFNSEFMKGYKSLMMQLRHDEREEYFDKWNIPNKPQK